METAKSFSWLLWFSIGSAIIAVSSGLGVIYAFRSSLPGVFLCFLGFTGGYKLVQMETHGFDAIPSILAKLKTEAEISKALMLLIGSLLFSQGFIFMADSIQNLEITLSLLSGFMISAGYVLSHYSVNRSVI